MKRKASTSTRKPPSFHIGPKNITRFELARVVGARALQIAMGAPILIDLSPKNNSHIDIALKEVEEGILPMSIQRTLPDGTSENLPLKILFNK